MSDQYKRLVIALAKRYVAQGYSTVEAIRKAEADIRLNWLINTLGKTL